MKLKKELIGTTIKVKDLPAVVIEDVAELYPYYLRLGLDVFEEESKRKKKSDKTNEGTDEQ
jgi:hypothetical protein